MKLNNATIRTIEILHLISTEKKQLTLSEISRTLNIPKSTAYQILQTLVKINVLEFQRGKTFKLGLRFFEIALPSIDRMDLRREARPIMEELSAKTGETVFVATYEGAEIVYIDQVAGPSPLHLSVVLGTKEQMHCNALGKAILAALPEPYVHRITGGKKLSAKTQFTLTDYKDLLADLMATRAKGYAVDKRELLPEISCVAAPIYNDSGDLPIGALSIVSHASKMTDKVIREMGKHVQSAAHLLSRRMGFTGQNPFISPNARTSNSAH